ncbi:MAG: DUF2927 domain-containing protein [Bradyrhizobium sp.]|nr:DUF2927 domain-containing protein [Bradyrhizobium sp.]
MIILAVATLATDYSVAKAEDPDITSRRAAERHDFTNDEIREGFFKVAFRAELQVGKPADRVRKFNGRVRIFMDSRQALPERRAEIAAIVADIGRRIDHLDLAITTDRTEANFTVSLVADREMAAIIRARYGTQDARRIEKSLNPQCLSGIGKDRRFRIRRAEVILPVDAGDFTFYDCAYEEILQGLGVINDDRSVPWTMFNDDVQMGFFDVYDQYLLNVLYDPRIRPGMTRDEVAKVMPEVLPAVRGFVASTNSSDHAEGRDSLGPTATRAAAQSPPGAQAN